MSSSADSPFSQFPKELGLLIGQISRKFLKRPFESDFKLSVKCLKLLRGQHFAKNCPNGVGKNT